MKSANGIDCNIVEYGDYQTPVGFSARVCDKLKTFYRLQPDAVLEPTFGIGNFFEGVIDTFPSAKTLYGIEINAEYYGTAMRMLEQNQQAKPRTQLYNADIFTFDFCGMKEELSIEDSLLIIGNPPWVTNSQLSSMSSENLPMKSNFKGHSGYDAMTGKGNFDIAEYIILKLLSEFAQYKCTLALLCKTVVAKNIVRDMGQYPFSVASMDLFSFNANEVFGVNCEAGLLVIQLGKAQKRTCSVYDFETDVRIREFGWIDQAFYADIQPDTFRANANIDGKCQFEWRQGVKHDCAKVMELRVDNDGHFINGFGEANQFRIGRFVYPLVKSSDFKTYEILDTRKYVIIPQRKVNEDTSSIQTRDPGLWEYLEKHGRSLSARKSAIYKNAPKYSIFGIGDYAFATYKVGVSGFYKEPVFALIMGDIPIMMDDTCYFISFNRIEDAVISLALLNSPICQTFLKSIAFLDGKRPFTKEVLRRINMEKLSGLVSIDYILEFVNALTIECRLTEADYTNYKRSLNSTQLALF